MPPPDAVAPVPTEVARFELMVEDRMVSFPFDRMPPPVAVEGEVASFPVTVTWFSVRGPKAKIPAPASTAAPPVTVSRTRCRALPAVFWWIVWPASSPSRMACGFPSSVRAFPVITKWP